MDAIVNRLSRQASKLITPLVLLGLSLTALNYLHLLGKTWHILLLDAAPLLFALVAIVLSQQFNRSRFVFAQLFVIAAAALQLYPQAWLPAGMKPVLFTWLMLNLLIFSLMKDRGLFSIHGFLRLLLLGSQLLALGYLQQHYPLQLQNLLQYELIQQPQWLHHYLPLADPLLLLALAICTLQLILTLSTSNRAQAIFSACQLALLAMLSSYQATNWAPLLIIAIGLAIIVEVLSNSYDMAYRDELTGLPSRRALNQLLLSLGRRYTIAMMDIDHFKKFNDTHGHDVGDEVLRMVATRIAKVGGGGRPFRYGGEEFTVVFPGKSPDQAEPHLEVLRLSIENYEMVVRNKTRPKDGKASAEEVAQRGQDHSRHKTLSVTISIGLAERSTDCKTPEQVIKAADEALYRAKKAGRNCVQR